MENYNIKFKKRLGQNFLKDEKVVDKIIDLADLDKESLVVEVGPGGGIMTKKLAEKSKHVLAYEIDDSLSVELNKRLNGCNNVDVMFKDFLDTDLSSDISRYDYKNLFFISNVPYYITTPIILKIINSPVSFNKIIMMVQKEVGNRFSTSPGNKEYGSITVLLNYFFEIKKEFLVSKQEFIPVPKVDSLVISFTERKDKLKLIDFNFFQKLVRDSFQFKRKTLRNNLKEYNLDIIEKVLSKYEYSLNVRAEALSLEVFVDLANSLCENN